MTVKFESFEVPTIPIQLFQSLYFTKDMKFITITLDPTFINVKVDNNKLIDYITTILDEYLIVPKVISFMYGCIEYHKSGIPHAHLIVNQIDFSYKIRLLLKPHFTNNKNNHKVIDEGFARYPNSIVYINKEPDSRKFGYGHKFPLIDFTAIRHFGIPPLPPPIKQKDSYLPPLRKPAYLIQLESEILLDE